VGLRRRKSPEEKAAAKAEKDARKASLRAQWEEGKEQQRAERTERREERMEKVRATLAPNETVEAELRTAETVMKKDLIFTSRRLIIGLASGENWESVPYRAITGIGTSNFLTKDIDLTVVGRRGELKLVFDEDADRDRALEVLNTFT
jgi:hypothetical protein